MPFLGIEDIESAKSFESQGFLGFGPNKNLFDPTLAIHADKDGQLAVWFGEPQPEKDLSYFFNLGVSQWSLPLTNVMINGIDIQPYNMIGLDPIRVASIDTTSKFIKFGRD